MTSISRITLAELFALAAIAALPCWFWAWGRLAAVRAPTEEKLVRPAGESVNRTITALDDQLIYWVALVVVGPMLLALTTQALPLGTYVSLLLVVTVLCAGPLVRLVIRRRNYALGYLGERVVGEELSQLLRDGCHVFHDYRGGANWNIDHIIVAPSGVYCVETKARRKRRGPSGGRDHEVIFDGRVLKFPRGSDAEGLEQARRNAKSLSRELTSATGESVKVLPVLTIPGWFVTLRGKGDVLVLNPKQIRAVVVGSSGCSLSPAQIKRIVHQLDLKCRDVQL